MLQRDLFGKHRELITKATRAAGRSFRRIRSACPFQLDLFIKRIPLGKTALKRIKSGATFLVPSTALRVVFKFAKGGSFFFSFKHQLFSITATDAALLEF